MERSRRRAFDVDVAPDRAGDVTNALRDLIGQLPGHPALVPIIDAGVTHGRPFIVIEAAPGAPLDTALHSYGPAEISDALPRLRRIADALDFAAAQGMCHGLLTPSDILVSVDQTFLSGLGVAAALRSVGLSVPSHAPYAAPEMQGDRAADAGADQFSFAAIAYEWLFGRPIALSTEDLHVRSLRGVDRDALARAFHTALSRDSRSRFPSCTAFVAALEQSCPRPAPAASLPFDDLPIYPGPPLPAEPREAAISARSAVSRDDAVATRAKRGPAVAAILIGAAALGAFVVWLAVRPRPQNSESTVTDAGQPFTEAAVGPTAAADASASARSENQGERRRDLAGAASGREGGPVAPVAPETDAVRASQLEAGLLVHSTPAGAAVMIDGIERGRTPVAVRGLALGTRTVVVTRPGYRPSQRLVTLTAERPSRSLEIGLAPATTAAPSTPTARDGSLVVDSRPAGAAVTIDGRPAGVTPLTIASLAPGMHTVRIEHPGYRVVTTSVDVVAGQRARVAARLEGGQDEE